MAMSLALVGAIAMFAWHHGMATMIAIDGSYWELFLGATNLTKGDAFG
jgi:hypothetical protein